MQAIHFRMTEVFTENVLHILIPVDGELSVENAIKLMQSLPKDAVFSVKEIKENEALTEFRLGYVVNTKYEFIFIAPELDSRAALKEVLRYDLFINEFTAKTVAVTDFLAFTIQHCPEAYSFLSVLSEIQKELAEKPLEIES